MAEKSGISWCDATFNPWIGCTKVSPACAHCYAEDSFDHRKHRVKWGDNGTRSITGLHNWRMPVGWNRNAVNFVECLGCGHRWNCKGCFESFCPQCGYPEAKAARPRVFCASLADVFEDWDGPIWDHRGLIGHVFNEDGTFGFGPAMRREDVEPWNVTNARLLTMNDLRIRLFQLIDATPNLDWLLLTKRPENIIRMIPPLKRTIPLIKRGMFTPEQEYKWSDIPMFYRNNVWLGTTVENQVYAETRIPKLLECRHLSPVLFLSCEPLLGPVTLDYPETYFPDGPAFCCNSRDCGCMGRPIDPPMFLNGKIGGVDWVIAGGESGNHARKSDPQWFYSLRDQCAAAHVPFHFKQWGEYNEEGKKVGKYEAGRVLHGERHDAFPEVSSQL